MKEQLIKYLLSVLPEHPGQIVSAAFIILGQEWLARTKKTQANTWSQLLVRAAVKTANKVRRQKVPEAKSDDTKPEIKKP